MTTWYISPTGSDSTGAGTLGNPYATINKAHTVATAGDTIVCMSGTYTHANNFAQTVTKALTIQAQSDGLAIFDAAATYTNGWLLQAATTIVGIKYINFIATADTHRIIGLGANSTTYNLSRCIFKNSEAGGGDVTSGAIAQTVNGRTGVTLNLTACLFDSLYSTRSSDGVMVYMGANAVNINNCTFYFTAHPVAKYDLTWLFAFFSSDPTTLMTTKNSIFYTNGGASKVTYEGFTTPALTTYSYFYGGWTRYNAGVGCSTSDPLFVDAPNGNFKLRPSSPCIGTGILL